MQELISSSSSSLSFLPAAASSVSLVSPSLGWLEAKILTLCKTKQKYSAAQMNLVVEVCNKVGVEGAYKAVVALGGVCKLQKQQVISIVNLLAQLNYTIQNHTRL